MLRRIREIKSNESGFTLIELLIVIVILGILAAIVVFAVSAFNKNGQQAACQSDFKSVEIADEAYYAKNQAYATTMTGATGALVPTYLREAPATNPNYAITIGATGPSLQVTDSTGATFTSTDSSACSHLTQ
jgi:prepilin-type N-terminal cleavage/methylation domain-containing protein